MSIHTLMSFQIQGDIPVKINTSTTLKKKSISHRGYTVYIRVKTIFILILLTCLLKNSKISDDHNFMYMHYSTPYI